MPVSRGPLKLQNGIFKLRLTDLFKQVQLEVTGLSRKINQDIIIYLKPIGKTNEEFQFK
jgi:hypothetical protein